jgi:hypothetical protein
MLPVISRGEDHLFIPIAIGASYFGQADQRLAAVAGEDEHRVARASARHVAMVACRCPRPPLLMEAVVAPLLRDIPARSWWCRA